MNWSSIAVSCLVEFAHKEDSLFLMVVSYVLESTVYRFVSIYQQELLECYKKVNEKKKKLQDSQGIFITIAI